jgi:hypothetical protein
VSKWRPFSFIFNRGNIEKYVGCGLQSCWWQRKCETLRCRDATASFFVAKVWGEIFAHFHAVAVKFHSSMQNWRFGLPEAILCEQSPRCKRKLWACSWLSSSPVSPFSVSMSLDFRVRLLLSSSNACLIISKISVPLFLTFAQNLTLFLCLIHREISSGQIHGSK